MIIGTAGHIDHGKTSLVRTLTGIDTDRLEEEKRRGITIDLGFAYQTLSNGLRIGFVDVPGHEKLIHTMVTGAAGIDRFLMIIAADDGVMPQTREHMEILKLIGVTKGFIALTRIDLLADTERQNAIDKVKMQLKGSLLEDAPLFPLSNVTGEGIDALKDAIAFEASHFSEKPSQGRFRHAIDRVFTLKGIGTVVTGTVVSGHVKTGDTVILQPRHLEARIRAIHVQDQEAENAQCGDRAAFNLVGLEKDDIHRGDMLADPFLGTGTSRFDVRLNILTSETKPLRQWFPVRVHFFSKEVNGRLVFLEGESGQPGEAPLVQIVTEKPLMAFSGDHFIIRDTSSSRTIGGGIVVDPFAPERHRRKIERLEWLKVFEQQDHLTVLQQLLITAPFVVDWQLFQRARNLDDDTAKILLDKSDGLLIDNHNDQILTSRHFVQKLSSDIINFLEEFHTIEPDLFGVGLEKLRRIVAPNIRAPLFRELLSVFQKDGFIKIRGAWVALQSHEAKLSDADQLIWEKVKPDLLGDMRFRPPRTRDFATQLDIAEPDMRRILKSLSRMGQLYEVAQDYFFPRIVLNEIIDILKNIAEQKPKGQFVAADLRDQLDNGRKISILILEFFDRHGVTIRHGDIRRLNPRRIDLFLE